MPFKSMAQMRKFYADPKLRKYADEMLNETTGRLANLPERARPPDRKGAKGRGRAR